MADTDTDKDIISAVSRALFRLDNPSAPTEGTPSDEDKAKERDAFKKAYAASRVEYKKKARKFVRQLDSKGVVLAAKEDA